MANVTTLHP